MWKACINICCTKAMVITKRSHYACYFSITKTQGFHHEIRKKILYLSVPFAILSVAHSAGLCVSKPPISLPRPIVKSSETFDSRELF